MNSNNVVSNLEQQIRWIEEIESHQFPGWLNVTNAMRDAIALLKKQEIEKERIKKNLNEDLITALYMIEETIDDCIEYGNCGMKDTELSVICADTLFGLRYFMDKTFFGKDDKNYKKYFKRRTKCEFQIPVPDK